MAKKVKVLEVACTFIVHKTLFKLRFEPSIFARKPF
jgi:hypothetical protein